MKYTVAPRRGHNPAPMDLPGWDPAAHAAENAAADEAAWAAYRARNATATARAHIMEQARARIAAVMIDHAAAIRAGASLAEANAAADPLLAEIETERDEALAALPVGRRVAR